MQNLLCRTVDTLRAKSNGIVPDLKVVQEGPTLEWTYKSIIATAWVDVVENYPELLPETAMLDIHRIKVIIFKINIHIVFCLLFNIHPCAGSEPRIPP